MERIYGVNSISPIAEISGMKITNSRKKKDEKAKKKKSSEDENFADVFAEEIERQRRVLR